MSSSDRSTHIRPFVYITGAGPGDKELLTLKAYRLLTEVAEAVIYDRLIHKDILSLIPNSCDRIYAGKSCGGVSNNQVHSMPQEEINALLAQEARKGKIVVRLKGGDPFIFGRGGEEAAYLQAHNIPFEVVPGITAAAGCASQLGIPLTHRGVASSVQFITGHTMCGEEPALEALAPWHHFASADTTLVIYMGLANLPLITEKLIANGLPADTPAAAVMHGTTSLQKTVFSTVSSLAAEVKHHGFTAPTLIIVGKVVALR